MKRKRQLSETYFSDFLRKKFRKVIAVLFLIFHFTFFISHSSIAFAIEVGGHLTEDTTWIPENNPYQVIDNIFVDEGVTLYIQPGVEIYIQSAPLTSNADQDNYFWYSNGNNAAKMIWVNGRIIAEGTQQDSIVFTRLVEEPDQFWGCILIEENDNASLETMSIFKHCRIEYSGSMAIMVGNYARAAVTIRSGYGFIENCIFKNNAQAVSASYSYTKSILISGSKFYNDENMNEFVENLWGPWCLSIKIPDTNYPPPLVINNSFIERVCSSGSLYFINNHCLDNPIQTGEDDKISYFYENEFIDCNTGIYGNNESYLYIKNNRFIDCNDGVDIDEAYVEISDNYFEGGGINGPVEQELIGKVENNIIINNSSTAISGRFEELYNNIDIWYE